MRTRQRRGIGGNRKAIGAAVFAGVLAVGGLTGVQFASAGENTKADGIVVVDGQQFDVSQCAELEINGGTCLLVMARSVLDRGIAWGRRASGTPVAAR